MIRDYEETSRLLKALRIEKGLTSHGLARRIGIDPATMVKRENHPELITIAFMKELAKGYEVDFKRIKNIFFTN